MSKPRVLVVVSDLLQRAAVGKLLHDKGYDVVNGSNGPDALLVLRTSPTMIIGVFLALPPFEEHRFLEEHRKDELLAKVKVIVASQLD